MHILVRRVKATGMTHHAHLTGFFLYLEHFLGVFPAVSQRNFNLHMLARFHTGNRLGGVHLRWGAQDHCIGVTLKRLFQRGINIGDGIFVCHRLGFRCVTTYQAYYLSAINIFQTI